MHIELYGRGDRLGANITCFIAQIIYAIDKKMFIVYNNEFINHCDNVRFVPYNQTYNKSIFIESLFYFIDYHNDNLKKSGEILGERNEMVTIHWFELISKVLLETKIDYFTYFKTHIFSVIKEYYEKSAISKNYIYNLPFNPKETILIHLRLDDVKNCADYNGFHCADHFRKSINSDIITTNKTSEEIQKIYPNNNKQSPLSKLKIEIQVNKLKEKYPNHEVIIITNPNENTNEYPYRVISSNDESYDLYLLSNCEIVILSRSTYALSSLFFNNIQKEVYIPLWGHIPCLGLFTKYDNTKYNYFE